MIIRSGLALVILLPAIVLGAEEADRHVDVGDRTLRAQVLGTGAPAVVFDTGMGDPLEAWGGVPGLVAAETTVVVYDRAGIGSSDLGPEPRDAVAVARDLEALLDGLELAPPFVLVGHSLGGLHIRAFAAGREAEVSGLVFIDPTTETMLQSVHTEEGQANVMSQLEGASEGIRAEARGTPARLKQVEAFGAPPDVPAVVISGMAPPVVPEEYRAEMEAAGLTMERLNELQELKRRLHEELATSMPRGRHVVLDDANHYVHLDRPEVVAEEILRIVAEARAGLSD